MNSLALVMITKNEERCLKRCLSGFVSLVDEIIIADTGSTDSTKDIARSFDAKVYDYTWQNDFSSARNYALEQSPCDWNLVIDADEYCIEADRKQLLSFLNGAPSIGCVKRIDDYLEEDGVTVSQSATWIPRLLPKHSRYSGRIHEQPDFCSLNSVLLPLVLGHDGYLYQNKGERNLPILLSELEAQPLDPYYLYQTAHTLRLLKRHEEADTYFKRFYQNAPRKYGYCTAGILSYLYNLLELKDWVRGLQIISQERSYLTNNADYWFFCGIFFTDLILSDTAKYIDYLPEIETSYLKCLTIGESGAGEGVLGNGSFKAAYNLGAWYEVSGDTKKAIDAYKKSAAWGYSKAQERLKGLH